MEFLIIIEHVLFCDDFYLIGSGRYSLCIEDANGCTSLASTVLVTGTNLTLDLLATDVDWPCEVKTLFREKNLGCKLAVSSGIDWFFENEGMGIILEDDCFPSQSFFWFCEELLERYKDDRIRDIISNKFK